MALSRRSFLSGALPAFAAPARRPSIVFILADDLGYGDLSCYNRDSKIPTPNLDKLASQGIRFTDAHTPSAVCSPTRYGLLTGRYAWRTPLKQGVLDGFDPPLVEKGRLTSAALLRKYGYTTACVGKWHLGMNWTRQDGTTVGRRPQLPGAFRPGNDVDYTKPLTGGPNAAGFDYYFGISASLDMSPYCFIENERTVGLPDVPTAEAKDLFLNQVPGVRTKDFTLEGVIPALTRAAVGFVERTRGPFFLYLPLTSPHLPIVPNKEFEGRSKAGRYGDFVVEMDAAVGQVLAALDRKGAASDTLVFFSSDNGGLWHTWDFREKDDVALGRVTPRAKYTADYGHRSNASLRGTKADTWEGGTRVPLIARWPGRVKAGTVSDALVCLTDFVATAAEIVGMKLPPDEAEDSISMMAALTGRKPARRDVVLHSLHGEFTLREGDWKLIESRGSGGFSQPVRIPKDAGGPSGQLYNLRTDPTESRNVFDENPEIVRRLSALLNQYRNAGRSRS